MAWTITPSFFKNVKIKHTLGGDTMIVIKLACISDASGGTITMRSSEVDINDINKEFMDAVRGSWLYLIKTVPGAGGDAPDGTFDLDVEDENNDHILDTDANASDANTFTIGSDTLGVYPPVLDALTIVIATLGNANTADIYLYFLK